MKNVKIYPINSVPEIYFLGRNVDNADRLKSRTLFWNGSGFEVHFSGQELWALFESGYDTLEPWIAVYVNGILKSREMIPHGKHWVCLARGIDDTFERDIRVIKDSQPMKDDQKHFLKIHKLALTKGGKFSSLSEHKMKIEFVGDSITTGSGLAGAVQDSDWIASQMSFCKTYAYRTAERLDADYRVMSQNGYGIVSAWNNNPYWVMPRFYEDVCSIVEGPLYRKLGGTQKYDFSKWQPDFVVINLGTNDDVAFNETEWKDPVSGKIFKFNYDKNGNAFEEDGKKIFLGVQNFLKLVRSKNPDAKIIWAIGMMNLKYVKPYILEGVKAYKENSKDDKVYSLLFESMDCETEDEDKGSNEHPGIKTHTLASDKLYDFILNCK